jgi:micrococcal nuclease
MYEYQATLIKVIDGDTLDLLVDQGIRVFNEQRLRLYGVNTPELHDKDPAVRAKANEAKQYLIDNLPTGKNTIRIVTIKDEGDKYGRLLAKVYVGDRLINQELIDKGLAVAFMV